MSEMKSKLGADDVVSGMGTGLEMVKAFRSIVEGAKGTEEHFRSILSDTCDGSILRWQLGMLLVNPGTRAVIDAEDVVFPVLMGDESLDQLFGFAQFTRAKIKIQEDLKDLRLPRPKKGRANLKLRKLPIAMKCRGGGTMHENLFNSVQESLGTHGLRLAAFAHYLAFMGKYRSVAKQFVIDYPHKDIEIRTYAAVPSDFTIRIEPCTYIHGHETSVTCLVYA